MQKPYLGNFVTTVNMSVPNSVVKNDHVNKIKANGCSIMAMPSAMTMQAVVSMGPRRKALGHDDCDADDFICELLQR